MRRTAMRTLRKSLVLKGKKGLDYYTVTVAIVGIFMLSFIVFSLFTKQYALSSGLPIGTGQFRLLKVYAAAEKALLFVDASARLALEQAAYKYGKNGFYVASSPCGGSGGFNYWSKDTMNSRNDCVSQTTQCYPGKAVMESTVAAFFTSGFSNFISSFNSNSEAEIPFDYGPFEVSNVVGRTEIVGKSKKPITIEVPNVKYEVKPSFRESIPVGVIAGGNEVIAGAKQLVKLSESDTKKKLDDEFDKAGKFGWSLVGYSKSSDSCTYDTKNSCSYVCGKKKICEEWCEEDPGVCCKEKEEDVTCDGTFKTTVSYDEFSSLFTAAENQKLLVNNPATGKPEFKDLEYDFGLSWIETGSSSDACS